MTSSDALAALDAVAALLERRLQAAIASPSPANSKIRCRFQQGRLLVLADERQPALMAADRQARFAALITALQASLPAVSLPAAALNQSGTLPVRLYLRQLGTAGPYAAQSWVWQPPLQGPPPLKPTAPAGSDGQSASENTPATSDPPGSLLVIAAEPELPPPADEPAAPPQSSPEPVVTAATRGRWFNQAVWQDWPWRSLTALVVVGLVMGGVAYGVTRPCLVGSCDRRQTASDLSRRALTSLQGNPTPGTVQTAHRQLLEAVQRLAAIPAWSPHYDAAQADLQRYRRQLADLERILAAQEAATLAAEKSQDPPHPVPRWVDIHLLWQKAVTQLQRVPDDSPVAELAQQKLAEYQRNYEAIGQRLAAEEQAEASLNEALQVAQVARTRTETATTLAEWLLAQQEWQRAVNALSRIPRGTLAHEEAQAHRAEYRTELIRSQTRVSLERAGERSFQAGVQQATTAQQAERDNQWTLAVDHWRQAIAQLRQVPGSTQYHADAQRRIRTYESALEAAERRLKQAVALQTLAADLAALCPANQDICQVSQGPGGIELTLRSPYDSAIRQSISPPSAQHSPVQATPVIAETHHLIQAIMQLGNQTELPITLYDSNQQFIARYTPTYGGFVRTP